MATVIYNLEGQRFGKLLIIKRLDKINHRSVWLARCDCGKEFSVYQQALFAKTKNITQCWECGRKTTGIKNTKDLTGQKFGKWTVIKRVDLDSKRVKYLCRCECGNESVVIGTTLSSGQSTKCRKCGYATSKHGTHKKSNTRLYNIWGNMNRRCSRKTATGYEYYGERGIKVCAEWKNDFLNFYNWAINNGYQEDLTIDRIDVNGNYSPENCRWVSRAEQSINKRNNRRITFNGETKTIKEWSDDTGLSQDVISRRLNRYNWSVERALTEPLNTDFARNRVYNEKNKGCGRIGETDR